MEVLTPGMMAECDQETIQNGYPEILLMEAAAYGTAELAAEITEKEFKSKTKKQLKLTVLVGKGNNGGDGLAAARILKNWGFEPKIILSTAGEALKGVNKKNFELACLNKIDYYNFNDLKGTEFLNLIKNSDLIIDALLGTGIKGELRGSIKKIIEQIEQKLDFKPLTLAVDIPSGIIGKTGMVAGKAIRADYTATMAAYKRGLLLYPGRDYAGKIRIVDIGIQPETIKKNGDRLKAFTRQEALRLIPERKSDGHKGSFGKAAVLAGSRGMTGAPLLSTEAALRSGAGLVYLLIPDAVEALTSVQLKEVVGIPLPSKNGIISAESFKQLQQFAEKVDLLAAGPGLGNNSEVVDLIESILKNLELPLILDADAVNSIQNLDLLKNYKGELILTPHPGEMSGLTGKSVKEINNNRLEIARNFAREYKVNLILKGAATITAAPDGRAYINTSGCSGMATAGSGDVLTGIISALRVQGVEAFEAAALAVYLHGRAGEFAAAKKSNFSLIASDITQNLSQVWQEHK
ncbi:MAG: NAD(P)H-hydrate dehydratase [Halanaerobium sp.]